jgi:hypothetical protein
MAAIFFFRIGNKNESADGMSEEKGVFFMILHEW